MYVVTSFVILFLYQTYRSFDNRVIIDSSFTIKDAGPKVLCVVPVDATILTATKLSMTLRLNKNSYNSNDIKNEIIEREIKNGDCINMPVRCTDMGAEACFKYYERDGKLFYEYQIIKSNSI